MQNVQRKLGVLLATVDKIEGYEITDVLGGVSGHRVLGTSFVSDWMANISDRWGGRAHGYEDVIAKATEQAVAVLAEQAVKRKANAIFGIRIEICSAGKGLFIASAAGTAVTIRKRVN